MKICHISTVHRFNDIRIFQKECTSLKNSGHQVTFLVNFDKDDVKDGIEIKALKKRKFTIFRLLLNLPYTFFYLVKNKFDLYHAHDPELIPIIYFLKLIGRNVIFDMHENFDIEEKKINFFFKNIIKKLLFIIAKRILPKINVVFAEKSYKKKYPYITNYIDVLNMPLVEKLNTIKTKKKHKRFTFGYIGSITEGRGIKIILKTIHNLQKKGYDIAFECAGPLTDRDLKTHMHDFSKHINNFKYHGLLSPQKSWEIMSKCHVGLAILDNRSNYRDSYPTKIFEYLALNIPIITSNFPLYKSITTKLNVGLTVCPKNLIEIEKAFIEIKTNKQLYNNFLENIEKKIGTKFLWNNEFKKLEIFYNSIVR